MNVAFRNKKLEACYRLSKRAFRTWGEEVGKRYIGRINIIKSAHGLEDLYAIRELRCHPLKGNRKGQFALSLNGFWRLIFTVSEGQMKIVTVEEVSKHYDD